MIFKELPVGACFHFSNQAFIFNNDSMELPVLYKKVLLLNGKVNSKTTEEDNCYILNTSTGQLTSVLPSHMNEPVIEALLVTERRFTELSPGDFFFFADNPSAISGRQIVLYQKTVISDNQTGGDRFYILNNNTGEMVNANDFIIETRVVKVLI